MKITVTIAALALVLAGMPTMKAFSCAQALPENRTPLTIAAEDALILYDEKTGTEQFIRQAVFDPSGEIKDFGFLVPTPTPPTLSTTESNLLSKVNDYSQPETVHDIELTFFGLSLQGLSKGDKATTATEGFSPTWVTVREQKVGDMDAAVIQASDAKTLRQWLTTHGYATRPALDRWLDSYVKLGWTITAFKIAENTIPSGGGKEAILAPVRMSFQTPHPFYPYKEPAEGTKDANAFRKLRILYIGNQRIQCTLSADMPGKLAPSDTELQGVPELSRPLTADQRSQIAKLAKLETGQSVGERLTLFEEHGDNRPADKDLYFFASADQSPVEYPSYKTIHETQRVDIAPWFIGSGLAIFGMTRFLKKKH